MPENLRQYKASIFQALAHPTRIAILELLRNGEMPVSAILDRLDLEPANGSQHLALLRSKNIVVTRKAGNQVYYTVRDRMIIDMLDLMRRYFQAHIEQSISLLDDTSPKDDRGSEA
jgi:ArsR family transcriptional regulator